jgi:hypothetical protein
MENRKRARELYKMCDPDAKKVVVDVTTQFIQDIVDLTKQRAIDLWTLHQRNRKEVTPEDVAWAVRKRNGVRH